MEAWISFSPWRCEEWRSHRSKRGIRQAIAYDRGRGKLRIFNLGSDQYGVTTYTELLPEEWDETFSEES